MSRKAFRLKLPVLGSLLLLSVVGLLTSANVRAQEIFGQKESQSPVHIPIFQEKSLALPTFKNSETKETAARTLSLPFFENFNLPHAGPFLEPAKAVPDTFRWHLNCGVQINRTSSLNPPDYGTAVFDGSDSSGRGYFLSRLAVTGGADTLTSHYIDLSAIAADDSSLHFSFWYQGGGRMERPDTTDSLVLQWRDSSGVFRTVWSTSEVDTNNFTYAELDFRRVSDTTAENIPGVMFRHAQFQFRFRNIATRNGPFDQWFVDHIYFDQNRTPFDTTQADRSVQAIERPLLWPYTAVPKRVLNNGLFNDSLTVRLRSTDSTAANTRLHVMLSDPGDGVGLLDLRRIPMALPPLADTLVPVRFTDESRWNHLANSTIRHTAYLDSSDRDKIRSNDTLRLDFRADTLFAYDDGEAETWYGVTNPNAAFGQAYYCEQPERLQAVWFHFVPRETIYDTVLTFNVGIWKLSIDTIRKSGVFLRDSVFLDTVITPVFLSGIEDTVRYGPVPNQFYRYAFDAKAIELGNTEVQGRFVVGMIQKQAIPIGVGYDKNYNNREQVFFQSAPQVWTATGGNGTLMIRPEATRAYQRKDPPIGKRGKENVLSLYPNPVQGGSFTVDATVTTEIQNVSWTLCDLTGRFVFGGQNENWSLPHTLELPHVPAAGIYLLRISGTTDTHEKKTWTSRLILAE